MAVLNVAERIKQVREIEIKIKAEETALEEKLKPFREFAEKARTQILQYLNETGQKSAATVNGTAYWKEKVTFRVQDKDEFRRHVIGTEQWELITWAAAGVACEQYAQTNEGPPPGLFRNAMNVLYINAPPKPRKKVEGNESVGPEGGDFWEEPTNDTAAE
jgi:hypothetical protein